MASQSDLETPNFRADDRVRVRNACLVAMALRGAASAVLYLSGSPAAGAYLLSLPFLFLLLANRAALISAGVISWMVILLGFASLAMVPASAGPGIWNGYAIGAVDALGLLVLIPMLLFGAVRRVLLGPRR